jgi:hypothetical protein
MLTGRLWSVEAEPTLAGFWNKHFWHPRMLGPAQRKPQAPLSPLHQEKPDWEEKWSKEGEKGERTLKRN